MCGIAGAVWSDSGVSVSRNELQAMTDVLRHRGPDDEGHFAHELDSGPPLGPGVALGHRRLSIIDVAGSRQPLCNEDGTVWIVFNGEIYNYRDLRRRLEGSGHRFRTAGDTETLVHLYEDEGVDFLQHLVGMFALALWDNRRRRLVLARDRLGQKPLVYRLEPKRLLFASELKSLLTLPNVPRDLDLGAVDEYLMYQYIPHPNTIFRGIRKLPPAHRAVYEDGRLRVTPYWSPDFNIQSDRATSNQVHALREGLTDAVRLRLRSDVPLGAFLSGGVDSSIIVGLMQQLSDEPIKTFSIGFPVPEYDETRYAQRVAQHLGTDHHEFIVEPRGVDILPKLVWHYDEPFADSSAIPTYYVSQYTRDHVTVALSGDGGDELFAGYPRYRAVRLADHFDRLPSAVKRLFASSAVLPASPRQKSLRRRWQRFTSALQMTPQKRYAEWITIFNESRRAALYSETFLNALPDSDPFAFLHSAFTRAADRDIITATSVADLLTYLPCALMTKVDIASMAHGLECRQPFLDHRVVELAMAMPLSLKLRGRQGKRIVRLAFGDLIPAEIYSRSKMGFGVPLDHWFRNELREQAYDILLAPESRDRGLFQAETIQRLLDEHSQGIFDHAYRLWSLLVLELWLREWQ